MAPPLLPALCAALVLAAASHSAPEKALRVHKCCRKGAQLLASEDACVPRPGLALDATKWEPLRPPFGETAAPWLPTSLRSRSVDVYYDALANGDAVSTETQRRRWVSARVDAEQEETVKRFLQVDSSERRFVLDVLPFRSVLPFAVKRQTFCFDTTDDPEIRKVILTIVEFRAINKCCPKSYRLDKNAEKCEPHQTLSDEDASEEILDPSENLKSAYWLPLRLMNSVTAVIYDQEPLLKWNVLVNSFNFEEHGFDFEEYEDTEQHYNKADELMRGKSDDKSKPFLWRFVEDESEYKLWVRGISRTGSIVEGISTEFCFDRTVGNLLPPRVVLARLWTLQKCCSRGEQLNAEATRCQPRWGFEVKDTAIEELEQIEAARADYWVPEILHGRKLLVEYLRKQDRKWFPKRQVTAADGDTWSLRDTSSWDPELLVRPQGDDAGGGVQVRNFCFDVAGDGPLARRVLLSVFPEVNKCCGRDEQLDVRGSTCVPRWGNSFGGDTAASEIINPERDPVSASWLPAKLRKNLLPVRYNYGLVENGGVVFLADHEDHLKLHFRSDGKLSFSIFSTTLTGKKVTQRVCQVCFDSIKGQPVALVADICFLQDFSCFFKCCSSGKLLSAEGLCVDNNGSDWSPGESAASVFLEGKGIYGAKALTHPICGTSPFYVQKPPDTAKEFAEILQNRSRIHRFSKSFFCADKLSGGGGEALAYCLAPPLAPTYEAVRPLGVVAALLLGAALAAILRRDATRRSAHGRALACHAACLLAANATQAAWFFLDRDDAYCKYYAYAIYFFLVAAGTWLNAISINLARGFKRPLGALSGARGGGGRGAEFALLSAWAWGAAVALTALCVAAHGHAQQLGDAGLYAPSLFETRTCFFEVVYTERQRRGRINKTDDNLGALFYYYTPMGILVVINTFCLIFTTCSITELRRGTSIVEKARAEKLASSRGFRSAVLYVKLLLTAGVVELVVEGVAWGARSRRFHGSSEWAEEFAAENAFVFAIVGTCLDVARAAAVLWLCIGSCDSLSFFRPQSKSSASPAGRKVKSVPTPKPPIPASAACHVRESPPVLNGIPSPLTEPSHSTTESPDAFDTSFMTHMSSSVFFITTFHIAMPTASHCVSSSKIPAPLVSPSCEGCNASPQPSSALPAALGRWRSVVSRRGRATLGAATGASLTSASGGHGRQFCTAHRLCLDALPVATTRLMSDSESLSSHDIRYVWLKSLDE